MKQRMLDTDTFSYILKRRQPVASRAEAYVRRHGELVISIITYYEVLRGLKYVNATRQLREVERFAKTNVIYPLDLKACRIAADIHATLRGTGKLIEDADLLIAANQIKIKMGHSWQKSDPFWFFI